ncbi:hypothetical protein AB205_0044250, partial [Aquarana catesbeiana]
MNRVVGSGTTSPQRRRLVLGILLLLLVDIIWVASSELTSEFDKPFFSTFAKTSMFVLYLLGFIVWRPWRQQCTKRLQGKRTTLFADAESYFAGCASETARSHTLSEPLYVPVRFHDLQNEKVSKSATEEK